MAKLTRLTGKVFAGSAALTDLGVFGSAKSGTPTNPTGTGTEAQIQADTAYDEGWTSGVVTSKNFPPVEEVNGVLRTISYQTCYILQEGIPEYDINTEYSNTSVVKSVSGNVLSFYLSLQNNNIGNALSDTNYWEEAVFPINVATSSTLGGVKIGEGIEVAADGTISAASLPIGSVFPVVCSSTYVPDNCLPCDGHEYSKSQFTELWTNYLTAGYLNTCSYSDYTSDLTTYGSCAKFAIDTVNNKFKVPTIPDGTFIQQASTNGELGTSKKAGVPNITGTFFGEKKLNFEYTGAFYQTTINNKRGLGSSDTDNYQSGFDASLSNQIYGASNTVQPKAVALRYFIVVASGSINQAQMDWAQWATSLASKQTIGDWCVTEPTTTSTATINKPVVVVENYRDGADWCRVYSDGWCEQGGSCWGTELPKNTSVSLSSGVHKPYKDTNYSISLTFNVPQVGDLSTNNMVGASNKTTSGFDVQGYKTTNKPASYSIYNSYDWVTKGFI